MPESNDSSIQEILGELKSLNTSLVNDGKHYQDFTQFKVDYFERNEDMRDSLRDIKGNVRTQSKDIDNLKSDVVELKNEFKELKYDLAPILELKQYIQEQVIRYSSVGFFIVLAATFGFTQVSV